MSAAVWCTINIKSVSYTHLAYPSNVLVLTVPDRISNHFSQYSSTVGFSLSAAISRNTPPPVSYTHLYDKEQAELTEKIEQYEREGRAEHDQLDKIQDFIDEVSKYHLPILRIHFYFSNYSLVSAFRVKMEN